MKKGEYLLKYIIVLLIIVYYFPVLFSKMYISTDEFSALAVPAILSGVDWEATMSFHSYHGIGYTILMTPWFYLCNSYKSVHFVVVIYGIFVKIVSAEILYDIFETHFKLNTVLAFIMSITYVCGPSSGDSYGISTLSEAPFSLCLIIAVWSYLNYRKSGRKKWKAISIIAVLYTYTIHSRSLILFIALILVFLVSIIKKRKLEKKYILFLAGIFVTFLIIKIGANSVQDILFNVSDGEELVNDPSTVLAASSYQLEKVFDIKLLVTIIQIGGSLLFSQCMLTLGVGAASIGACIYTILINRKKQENVEMIYISLLALLCIFGMDFAIGIQATGRIEEGNYAWLTYTRYAEPFWVLAYIVFVYYLSQKITPSLKIIFLISTMFEIIYIGKYLVGMLGEYGLQNSVINRIFYYNQPIECYLRVFCKIGLMFVVVFILICNCDKRKNIFFVGLMVGLLIINFQYIDYYLEKEESEYTSVAETATILNKLNDEFDNLKIYANPDKIIYSSKIQYVLFDKATIKYANEKNSLKDNIVYISNSRRDYKSEKYIIEVSENQYIFTSNDDIYNEILNISCK